MFRYRDFHTGSKESIVKIFPHRTKPRKRARSLVKISIFAPTIADFFPADQKKKKKREKPPMQREQIAFSNESHVKNIRNSSRRSNGK